MKSIPKHQRVSEAPHHPLNLFRELSIALGTGIASVAMFYSRSGWSQLKPKLPLMYFGDPIYYANLVHNAQLGNPLFGKNLGGPSGQQFNLTAYGFEWVQSWVVSLFAAASSGPWLAMNRFVLFTFFATGFFAYIAFRWIEVSSLVAILCATSFALIPDHQPYSVGLANMSAFVLTIAIICKIASGTPLLELFNFPFVKKWSNIQKRVWNLSLIFIIALYQLSAATYYLLLGSMLAGSVIIFLAFTPGNMKRIKDLSFFIIIQVLVTFICLTPIVISRMLTHLPFSETSTGDRRPFAAYANGGDIFALFSPLNNQSAFNKLISHLPKVSSFYNEYWSSPLTSGSEYIVHSGGILFIFLLITSILYFFFRKRSSNLNKFDEVIKKLNLKTLIAVFFLTLGWYFRGGFGTFFSFIFPYVRGYARYSAFLTFCGLAILGVLASKLSRTNLKFLFTFFLVLVLADNLSAVPKIHQDNAQSMVRTVGVNELAGASTLASGISFRSLGIYGAQQLDSAASKKLLAGCTVLELPLVTYPVDFAIGITSFYTYEIIKPGLEASTLKWSAGGIPTSPNNRFTDRWLGRYQTANYQDFFRTIANNQYCGVLMFRGIQQAFYEAGAKNGSNYGPSDDITRQLIRNFGSPCYSDVISAVDLYCIKSH